MRAKPVEPPPAPKKAAASPIVVIPLARTRPIEEVRTRPALTPKEALAAKTKAAQAAKSKVEAKPAAPESMPSTLAPEWVTAGWEGALDAAKAAGHAASALVDAWVAASNVAAVAALAAAESYEGPARKAARRAVNILKARGVAIPEAPRVARPLADDKHDSVLGATFVPPDPTGAGSITITRRDPSGRYQIAEVIARDPMGILDAGGGWISGSQLRESRARVVEMFGTGPVPVPVEWARFRIAESRKQTLTAGRVLPLGLERCRDLLDPVPESEPAHPASDLEAGITGEQTTAAVAASGRLHDEPELRSWMPDRPAIDDMLRKLGERLGTDGLQDQEKVSEGLKAEIDDATDRFFSPEVRAVLVRRLRDSAISIRARKGDVRATEVLAVAKAITDAGLITSPPREIPFLVAMFQKAVSYMLQQGNGSLRIPVAAPAQQA